MNINTSHGAIAVEDVGTGSTAIVFIHGNSSCKEIFAAQLSSSLREHYRLVSLDLPGHGASENAHDPTRTYTIPGYASVVREVVRALGIEQFIVVGWSLGGHIGIELLAEEPRPLGLVITGTPPFAKSMESIGEAFMPTPHMGLTGKPEFTDEDAMTYARATAPSASAPEVDSEDFRYRAARRTDGRARARMMAAFGEGLGVDQRRTVEEIAVPLAIINGADDAFLNHAYFAKPRYANLWRGAVESIAETGHAPFFAKPEVYNALLSSFCADVQKTSRRD